jgi:glycosyltransferase involved in cell wall biosynthesis
LTYSILVISASKLTYGAKYHLNQTLKALNKSKKFSTIEILLSDDIKILSQKNVFKKILPWSSVGIFNLLYIQFFLPLYCIRKNISVLYCPWGIAPIFFKGIIILGAHNPLPLIPNTRYSLRNFIFSFFYQISLKISHIVKVPSKTFGSFLADKYSLPKKKFYIVEHGIEVEHWKYPANYKFSSCYMRSVIRPYFIFWSWFHETKNITRMILAFEKFIRSSYPNSINLLMAGKFTDSLYELEIKKLISKLGLDDSIQFLINPSHESLVDAIQNSSGIYLPFEFETFGFPYVEARVFDKPIAIGLNLVSLEISENQCYYFDPGNIDSMTDSFRFLQNNCHHSFKYSISDKFRSESEVNNMSDMFEKVLK